MSAYAHKEIAWETICEKIIREVQNFLRSKFGKDITDQSQIKQSIRQQKMDFGMVEDIFV